ncbi:head-tail adaptor protein [Dyadobacter chenwenxiniae]|uniref:Head-tail adaptor protein n=1 Tax=Dyadobacter chenwenxiniae TaxID=2906456 RepID=A0A9X1PIL3_9BACT|nr:head-tail adaptor protein [Dyadobacter chenwenxiniae]MCF0060123.1 head-tail adaptor protein [Dyadobacter chenwenxiniae]UON85861.1 head-tail adaptor protein [Dyadobacter chenwenxiniae]
MAKRQTTGPGIYDRRIAILRPQTIVNDFNEEFTGEMKVVYTGVAANREDTSKTDAEDVVSNVMRSILFYDYRIRFMVGLDIKTSWQIKDLFDGRIYKIIAPVSEVGRREGLLIKTQYIE